MESPEERSDEGLSTLAARRTTPCPRKESGRLRRSQEPECLNSFFWFSVRFNIRQRREATGSHIQGSKQKLCKEDVIQALLLVLS